MGDDDRKKRSREMEKAILEKVRQVTAAIDGAKHADEVICALYSLGVLLFPIDSRALSGVVAQRYRYEVLGAEVPSEDERSRWWLAFYQGAAFPTLARVLLYDVATNWLACFPLSARRHVYDVFFVNGCMMEVVQTVVPCLQKNGSGSLDINAVHSNVERVLALCLLENDGILHLAREFRGSCQAEDIGIGPRSSTISRVAQLVTSIPDKAQLRKSNSLSSHLFFKQITMQFIAGAEEWDANICNKESIFNGNDMDGTIQFVGESFARICRRGSADVLLNQVIPHVLRHVRSTLFSNDGVIGNEVLETKPGSRFWLVLMEAIKDLYAVERLSEQLLHWLAAEHVTDVEAYWILWMLFHQICEHQNTIRSMFVEKFLLWKVFPVCCLRWILQFAVLEFPPDSTLPTKGREGRSLLDIAQHLAVVWAKKEFVQSAPLEQQAYVTSALGLSLEKMSKEDLDATKDVMRSILEGVSCRLASPIHLVRRMASSIALVFSRIIDPENPLYLDDNCTGETIDWEFGLATPEKGTKTTSQSIDKDINEEKTCNSLLPEEFNNAANSSRVGGSGNARKKKLSEFKLVDPDEIIDPAALNNEAYSVGEEEEDDDVSENSETSGDSSLQPYDLSDDDTDLKRKLSHLVDVIGALRKSDEADGVERALDVAEKLVRASPDELRYVAGDLVRTLIQARCSDSTIEGEEESAEEKRQRSLVALVVMSPFESLDSLNKLLYSPNVDVSQRILILDVMADAAQELANSKIMKPKHQSRNLISTISETQPWFMPSSIGPPGAGPWKEVSRIETPLNWSYSYERELPLRRGQIKRGKTRRWSVRSSNLQGNQMELSQNKFPQYAAAFMLPAMQGFDKKRHGVDLIGRDFIVLGKLIYMLGVCMKCIAMHPEASALAFPLLDMLSSREICHHAEAYIRRSVLFAASCILLALHPSFVASSLMERNHEISKGLEWVRSWALHVAESDTDRDCYTLAVTCLQLHAEMALQASRILDSAESTLTAKSIDKPMDLLKGTIKIPHSSVT
ncbi:uncharacterized protein LOC127795278 isoform X3 [Diospyros lotus]|nr:uncharacterized protein LOC127795278 isoform X2 [Diospyros lotus]XP_052182818.1 uncharacterized protein LOC127795278 isoform X3 [Diospyros lotus]XP_052182819.1 uncharacterized protein LOC127795278 isoform X4 [Diospyros lotus]XP_052182822.1 uncharacterized protein LOC127795278 isoform X2 [Diospyros lotus]XP_052182823.1 uncharacterized protein LOC127795278 isoform X3 [Diospyros lotus]